MRFPWEPNPLLAKIEGLELEHRAAIEKLEKRENAPFTDAVINGILAATAPAAQGDAQAIGALETAAAIWSRAFAAATVTPVTPVTESITPSIRAVIGRELVRRGECVFAIKVVNGMFRLVPAGSWDVRGPWSEDDWDYRVDLFGASEHETELLPSAGVVHARYSIDPGTPWIGVAPLKWARLTGTWNANVETRLGEEAGAPVGHLLPVPAPAAPQDGDDAENDPTTELRRDLKALKGGVALVETTAAGMGLGRSEAPQADWVGRRFGADPPAAVVETYGMSALAVLNACGVPVSLATDADGTSQREAWRRLIMGAVQPTANMVAEELGKKLDTPDLRFDFSALWAHDLAGRASSVKAMVTAGLDINTAMGIAGLNE